MKTSRQWTKAICGATNFPLNQDGLNTIIEQIQNDAQAHVKEALDKSGTAIGNEHETYSLAQRVEHLATARDYFMRQCDEARDKLKALAEPANIRS